jgi:single-strand DNA-binding protein
MINKAILLGNLTEPPMFTQLQNGGTVARVKLATNKTWKDKATGERKSVAEYHTCDVWNQLAETLQKLDLDTGTQVYIEGEIHTKTYEKDGVKKWSTVIKLGGFGSEFRILSKREPKQEAQETQQTEQPKTIVPVASDEFEDDIPF